MNARQAEESQAEKKGGQCACKRRDDVRDDRREDVDSRGARRLGIRRQLELIEHGLHDHRDLTNALPRVARLRVRGTSARGGEKHPG